jgi:uncharacterized SAM-binding protein YcdF (DUF218 family)
MKTMKAIRWLFFLSGGLCMANSLILIVMISFNLGLLLTFVLGLALFIYGVFFSQINTMTDHGIGKGLRYFFYSFLVFLILVISFLSVYGSFDTADYREDAVIVLGAGIRGETITGVLQYRLQRAVFYWQKNPDALIVVSGGQGPGESITEAEAMERYLLLRGIPPGQIVKEGNSTSTYENFLFSKKILDSRLDKDYRVVFITNGFHIYRGEKMAQAAGLVPTHLHTGIQWYLTLTAYIREFAAVLKLWVFGP